MSENAELKVGENVYTLPIITGSEEEQAIDISKLRAESGLVTIDPGYKNTGSTQSAITFLDGENGILRYRGYPIEQLAEKATFPEVIYLLIYGDSPVRKQLDDLQNKINNNTLIPADMKKFFDGYPFKSHHIKQFDALYIHFSPFS